MGVQPAIASWTLFFVYAYTTGVIFAYEEGRYRIYLYME